MKLVYMDSVNMYEFHKEMSANARNNKHVITALTRDDHRMTEDL